MNRCFRRLDDGETPAKKIKKEKKKKKKKEEEARQSDEEEMDTTAAVSKRPFQSLLGSGKGVKYGYYTVLLYGCVSQRQGTTEFTNLIG